MVCEVDSTDIAEGRVDSISHAELVGVYTVREGQKVDDGTMPLVLLLAGLTGC